MDPVGRTLLMRKHRELVRELRAVQDALKPAGVMSAKSPAPRGDPDPILRMAKSRLNRRTLVKEIRRMLAEEGRPCAREEIVLAQAGSGQAFGHDLHEHAIRNAIDAQAAIGLFTEEIGRIGLAEWTCVPPKLETATDSRVREVVVTMHAELDEPITIGALAERVNLSPSRLSHLFRNQLALTPAEYLGRIRVAAARHMLRTTHLSQKEILAATGIADRTNFTRQFKRFYGASPRQFRVDVRVGRNGQGESMPERLSET